MRKVLSWLLICSFVLVTIRAADGQGREGRPRNIILIGWDGAQRNHVKECLNRGELPNLERLSSEGALVAIDILRVTDTKAGWTEILTGYEPEVTVFKKSSAIAEANACTVALSTDLMQACEGADVIYTDVWASMGQEAEAKERRKFFMPYQVNRKLLEVADEQVIIMHCLPAHYGEEIEYEVSRTPHSVIFDQAENRLHAQKALMTLVGS